MKLLNESRNLGGTKQDQHLHRVYVTDSNPRNAAITAKKVRIKLDYDVSYAQQSRLVAEVWLNDRGWTEVATLHHSESELLKVRNQTRLPFIVWVGDYDKNPDWANAAEARLEADVNALVSRTLDVIG